MVTGYKYFFNLCPQEFLADYGMIWVGPETDCEGDDWGAGLESQTSSSHTFWNPGIITHIFRVLQ